VIVLDVIGNVLRLLGSIFGILVGTLLMRKRVVRVFRRRLRRAGLSPGEVDALTEEYDLAIGFRDLIRVLRIRIS